MGVLNPKFSLVTIAKAHAIRALRCYHQTVLSISTMWAQQDRFQDLTNFRRVVASMGYDAIEISHSTAQEGLRALLEPGEIPLSSLHAPTPRRKLPDDRTNSEANLAATDEDERALAVAETKRTIEYAAQASLRFIVVHLGGIGSKSSDSEVQLKDLFRRGIRHTEQVDALKEKMKRQRAGVAEAHLEAAARSLRELVEAAKPHGIALGLESRLHYHEIPHPEEALQRLESYDNSAAGYWHDVGHCEVMARLGLIERSAWFPALTDRTIGTHLHDVDGLLDHRAPGNGDVDWRYIAAGLPETALRVFEIDQGQPDEKVAGAPAFLRKLGVVS